MGTTELLARAASIICEAACGLYPQCKSREAAKALFDAGLLQSPETLKALRIAASRLNRSALDHQPGSRKFFELSEWADEAQADLDKAEGRAP